MPRYHAPGGVAGRPGLPEVYVNGQLAPSGTVRVDGNFFTLQHRPDAVVLYHDLSGELRQARRATALVALKEAIDDGDLVRRSR